MNRAGRTYRPPRPVRLESGYPREKRGIVREYGPVVFGGGMLVMSFAFAGHYMGQNASAHTAGAGTEFETLMVPSSNIVAKGSLLPEGSNFDIVNMTTLAKGQAVVAAGKGDLEIDDPGVGIRIVPAAVNMDDATTLEPAPVKKRLALSPSRAKIEQSFKLKRSEKQKVIAERRLRLAEENCLARAIYFEARSESELGQLAVAKVILNRVKDANFPKTICGVVYQGSGNRNSCQFSFACDGLPDDVKQPTAWANSKRIAKKAMSNDTKVASLGTATNYHADYVNPKWAKSMKRLIKIGRHIFYSDT